MVDGEGGSSERCLKWGGGGWGSLRDLFKNILKQGWVKTKVVRRGEGFEGVTTPAPPPEIYNRTPRGSFSYYKSGRGARQKFS